MTTMGAASIELRGLGFRYPDGTPALDDVDLKVDAGERVAIIGPNGAGKSTLALHLNGIHTATIGQVAIGDVEVGSRTLRDVRRRVGLVFQDPDDQLFMPTVGEDVAFGPRHAGLRGDPLRVRVGAALAAVGMEGTELVAPHHLSTGQRRRVAIATVLATEAEVLVLDEPTANLDPASRRDLLAVLDRLDCTQIVITHDLPFAAEVCRRVVLLDEGRVVADAAMIHVLGDPDLLADHRLFLPRGFDPGAV